MRGLLFFQLLSGAVLISTALFQLDIVCKSFMHLYHRCRLTYHIQNIHVHNFQAAHHIDTNFIVMVFVMMTFVSGILPYCYISSRITKILESIGTQIYTTSWYSLPVIQQKSIRMIIRCGQMERRYSGYHLIGCSMISFLMVHIRIHARKHCSHQSHYSIMFGLFTDSSGSNFLLSAVQTIFSSLRFTLIVRHIFFFKITFDKSTLL